MLRSTVLRRLRRCPEAGLPAFNSHGEYWLAGSVHVVVYGEWRHTSEVTGEVESRYAGSFRPDDESVCVWTDPADRTVLMIGFDIEAVDLESAMRSGRAEILEAAQAANLSGELRRVTSITDEGYRTWSA